MATGGFMWCSLTQRHVLVIGKKWMMCCPGLVRLLSSGTPGPLDGLCVFRVMVSPFMCVSVCDYWLV